MTPHSGAAVRIYTADDLAKLPPPRYLLPPFIQAGVRNELFGSSGAGKTFLALDWACCIAAGVAWNGRPVIGGPVIYIASEGHAGLSIRLEAWRQAHGLPALPPRMRFIPQAVNFMDGAAVEDVRRAIVALPDPPVLIVVDTMARCMAGGDENSARDVGLYIAATDALARAWGAAILNVHHTGKSGDLERGSSALRGAAETMHSLRTDGAALLLKSSKAKDAADYQSLRMRLTPSAQSCVITVGSRSEGLKPGERKILQRLPDENGSDQVSTGELEKHSGLASSTFYNYLEALSSRGFVGSTESGKFSYKWITPAGRAALLQTAPNASYTGTSTTPTLPVTLRDGSVE